MFLDWPDVLPILKLSARIPKISIKKPRMQRRRKIQRWSMSLAQPAVNKSEYSSTSHSDLIFGNSCWQLKKQNVLAVRTCLLI